MAQTPRPTMWAEAPEGNSDPAVPESPLLSWVSAWIQPRQMKRSAAMALMMVRRQDKAVRSGCSPGSRVARWLSCTALKAW